MKNNCLVSNSKALVLSAFLVAGCIHRFISTKTTIIKGILWGKFVKVC